MYIYRSFKFSRPSLLKEASGCQGVKDTKGDVSVSRKEYIGRPTTDIYTSVTITSRTTKNTR